MTELEVLKEARRLIQKGWTRGVAERRGRYCLLGAVVQATRGCPYLQDQPLLQARVIVKLMWATRNVAAWDDAWNVGGNLEAWNDAQKSKKPVLELVDRLIAEVSK